MQEAIFIHAEQASFENKDSGKKIEYRRAYFVLLNPDRNSDIVPEHRITSCKVRMYDDGLFNELKSLSYGKQVEVSIGVDNGKLILNDIAV